MRKAWQMVLKFDNWEFYEKLLSHLPLCFHAGFVHGLFFDPDDGGDMFL
jgi:hypothetical protein